MRTFIFLMGLFVTINIYGQNQYSETIDKQGREMSNSFITKDYEVLAAYTYPKIVEISGGKERLIQAISQMIAQMEASGLYFSEVLLGQAEEIYTAGDEVHCLVPQRITMTNDQGRFIKDSYLLAISMDKGKKWYFLDTAKLTNENAKTIFPEFNDNLVIPAKKENQFIPN